MGEKINYMHEQDMIYRDMGHLEIQNIRSRSQRKVV